MGFFSWLTADTNESIANRHSGIPVKPVYLIQPGGREPILETEYDGYGVFGYIDAYVWLANENRHMIKRPAAEIDAFDEDTMRLIGVTLGVGGHYIDQTDGSRHCIFDIAPHLINPEVMFHNVRYDEPIAHFGGKSANELTAEGRLVRQEYNPDFPLKFSRYAEAVYEDLPASLNCPDQGIYYQDDDEDEKEDDLEDDIEAEDEPIA